MQTYSFGAIEMNLLERARDTVYTAVGLVELSRMGMQMRKTQQAMKRAAAEQAKKRAAAEKAQSGN